MPRKSYIPGDFELVVRRSKTGLGLFAESEIPKGACIIEYTGVELTKEQEDKSRSKYLFEIHSRKTIDGAPRWNTARYINHSCRPNCEPNIHKGRIYIHARARRHQRERSRLRHLAQSAPGARAGAVRPSARL